MCKTSLGIVLKPMMAIFGLTGQVDQIQEAIKSGDPVEISVRFLQLICMLFGLTSQCFTGDTLVSTEYGLFPIEEIQAGAYVWSENTETGEKELKKVLTYLTDALSGIDKNDKEKNEEALRGALKELRQLLLDNPRLPYKGGWDD